MERQTLEWASGPVERRFPPPPKLYGLITPQTRSPLTCKVLDVPLSVAVPETWAPVAVIAALVGSVFV